METEPLELARILHGEAVTCYNLTLTFLALAYVYQRNPTFYGYYTGDDINSMAVHIAYTWYMFADPTNGANYVFSSDDLRLSKAAYNIAQERGPPVLTVYCDGDKGADKLLFYK